MKPIILAGLAALALAVGAPTAGNAQVRVWVDVGVGARHRYVQRVHVPPAYYQPSYRHARTYGYMRPRVEVVRVYRPAPVLIYHRSYHRNYHRVYRHW